jgi:hypothetical protein
MANDIGWGEGACNNDIGWGIAQEYFSCSGSGEAPVGATLIKTGQTTSYRTGDDGDLEAGRATDFFTLASNNPFGNTNRFTDELGGQTYTNNIVIDWSTYNGATVLGYYRISIGTLSWNDAIDTALSFSISIFSLGWRLPNNNEILNLLNYSNTNPLNYSPFNITFELWSSTTYSVTTSNAWRFQSVGSLASSPKINLRGNIAVRTFTVTGTTLT